MKITTLFISLCLSAFVTSAVAGDGERLLDKFIDDIKTMTADFSQSLRSSDGEVLQESKGKFFLHKPGQFRWDYNQPYAQEIVSDGEHIWIHDIELKQVTVQKQSVTLASTPMALLQDKISVSTAFSVQELDNQNGIYRLLLITKDDATDFQNIILGLSESGLQFMQMRDQFDQRTDIIFSNIKVNQNINASVFNFKAPEGTDIFGGS